MEKIIDTPYADRCCDNCSRKQLNKELDLYYCRENDCYIVKNKWCQLWRPQYRVYEFEK